MAVSNKKIVTVLKKWRDHLMAKEYAMEPRADRILLDRILRGQTPKEAQDEYWEKIESRARRFDG